LISKPFLNGKTGRNRCDAISKTKSIATNCCLLKILNGPNRVLPNVYTHPQSKFHRDITFAPEPIATMATKAWGAGRYKLLN